MRTRLSRTFWPSTAAIALLIGGVAAGPAAAGSAEVSTASTHSAAHRGPVAVPAKGDLAVRLDPSTASATPAGRSACRLRVEVALDLSGTVQGTATGVTVATINAPCAEATTTPPGTFADVFSFTGSFQGTVAGAPTAGRMEYAGVTRRGGAVSAGLVLQGQAQVVASVQASAGESGVYRGIALVPRP